MRVIAHKVDKLYISGKDLFRMQISELCKRVKAFEESPQELKNPLRWFPPNTLFKKYDPNLKAEERTDEATRLMICYVTLAIIHDKVLIDPVYRRIWFDSDYGEEREQYSLDDWANHSQWPYVSDVRAHGDNMRIQNMIVEMLSQVRSGISSVKPAQVHQSKDVQGSGEKKQIKKRFTFSGAQAFFDKKDLGLPTGAEVELVDILEKLVKSFGKIIPYKDLDENSGNTATDVLRGKIRTIRNAFTKHEPEIPCKIMAKKWKGYILSDSHSHS